MSYYYFAKPTIALAGNPCFDFNFELIVQFHLYMTDLIVPRFLELKTKDLTVYCYFVNHRA